MIRKISRKLTKIFRSFIKKTVVYYYPYNNINATPTSFSLKLDLKKSCAEFIAQLVEDVRSPFYGAENLEVHLTAIGARSAFPAELTLSPDIILKDVLNFRKVWVVIKQNVSEHSENLSVKIHYRDGESIEHYGIVIPLNDAVESDPFAVLIRKAKLKAPMHLTGTHISVGFTMSQENSKFPGFKEFTKGDFKRLEKNDVKLWIERKVRFAVKSDDGKDINLEFFPEQDFATIKWIVASKLKQDVEYFEIIAKRKDTTEFVIGPRNLLSEFEEHAFLIRPSATPKSDEKKWICKHNKNEFDLFFSHRQSADKDIVKLIHSELDGIEHPKKQARRIHPFWDSACLLTAEDWEDGFISALRQSNVAVLFISDDCLRKVMQADLEADNVLLEWEETLQKYPSQNLIVFPIHVGRNGKQFDGFNHLAFPDEKHCHPRSPKVLSIRRVVQEIFRIQGESVVELSKENIDETKAKLLNTLSKIAEHNESKSSVPLVNLLLNSSQDQQLREFLHPLDKEMKAERSRLLQSHVANTRLWLLKALMDFLNPKHSNNDSERVFWLQGNAGVGKSVMAAFAADELEKRNMLAGMFFVKHDDVGRNNARNLIRTLCYQLCEWNADFGRLILEKLSDEIILREVPRERPNIEKLFQHLILTPLQEIEKYNPAPIVLIVDALDETGLLGFRSEILQVFSLHCSKLPVFVKFLVTSRPEEDIVQTFRRIKTKVLEATDSDNRKDALIFARHFLRQQGLKLADVEQLASLLTEKSGGLFVWLTMACRNLESLTMVGQNITVMAIEKLGDGGSDRAMDAIYFSTFDRIFGKIPPERMRDVLSTITLAYEPLKVEDYSLLLQCPLDEIKEIIFKLQPILYLNTEGRIRFFHKSVADYLIDPERCHDIRFSVHTRQFHTTLTDMCLEILLNNLTYNVAGLPLHTVHKDIPNFATLVSANVSPHLKYAAVFFWRHHLESDDKRKNFPGIKTFTENMLLNWIELLSLVESTNIIPSAAQALSENYEPGSRDDLSDFTVELLADTVRLYQKFSPVISASALQTYVTAIPFSPKGTRIYNHFIKKLPTQQIPKVIRGTGNQWSACLMTLEGHRNIVRSTQISPDGNFIVSGSEDCTIKIWSITSGEEIKTLSGHEIDVRAVAISKDGEYIVSGSMDRTVKVWSVKTGEQIRSLVGHLRAVWAVAISSDGKHIASGSWDGAVKIWSTENGKQIYSLEEDFDPELTAILAVAISPDGKCVVSGNEDGTITIWSIDSGKKINRLSGHTNFVRTLAISADGNWIVSGSFDKTIKIWSMKTGEEIKTLSGSLEPVLSLAISVDGKFIVSGNQDNTVCVWLVESGKKIKTLSGHSDSVRSVDISSDCRTIVSASEDRTIKIWSLESREDLSPAGHSGQVCSAVISSDGKYMVSGSEDKSTKIWSMEIGEEIRTLTGHPGIVESVEISIDGKYVLSQDLWGRRIYHEFETGSQIDLPIANDSIWTSDDAGDFILRKDGWIAVGKKFYCWFPSEFRDVYMKIAMNSKNWRVGCVGKHYFGAVDFSLFC